MITYDFSGKHAVITGAGGGMGEEIAFQILSSGGQVTGIDIKDCPARLKAFNSNLSFESGDLTDEGFVSGAIARSATRYGCIDALANVAGVLWFDKDVSLFDIDMDVWDSVFDINLRALVYTTRETAKFMKASSTGGAMVHFSTTQWYRGDASPQDAYQASKAAVCAMSKSIAMQLATHGIRSNAICPGATLTPMQARWDTQDKINGVASAVPLGRVANPTDMANAALFLLSDAASYITGIELIVDGGMLMK